MSDLSRRQFFRLKPVDFIPSQSSQDDPRSAAESTPSIRPPGALRDEKAFLSACQRCRACSKACPHGVIEHLGPAAGCAEGTPSLDPNHSPCRWCSTMDCIHACKSGALQQDPRSEVAPIGLAQIDLDRCLNTHGILCDACVQFCPSEIQAIALPITTRLPQIDPSLCVGCGLCVYHCEAAPSAIHVTPPPSAP